MPNFNVPDDVRCCLNCRYWRLSVPSASRFVRGGRAALEGVYSIETGWSVCAVLSPAHNELSPAGAVRNGWPGPIVKWDFLCGQFEMRTASNVIPDPRVTTHGDDK